MNYVLSFYHTWHNNTIGTYFIQNIYHAIANLFPTFVIPIFFCLYIWFKNMLLKYNIIYPTNLFSFYYSPVASDRSDSFAWFSQVFQVVSHVAILYEIYHALIPMTFANHDSHVLDKQNSIFQKLYQYLHKFYKYLYMKYKICTLFFWLKLQIKNAWNVKYNIYSKRKWENQKKKNEVEIRFFFIYYLEIFSCLEDQGIIFFLVIKIIFDI